MHNPSDAFYIQQLLERLDSLQTALQEKIGPESDLHRRTQKLHQDLTQALQQPDEVAQGMMEYSLLPKMNRLLLDARQQLKLKRHAQRAQQNLTLTQRRERLIKERSKELPTPPQPPAYHATPKPIHDEERKALIEDALTKLKALLNE